MSWLSRHLGRWAAFCRGFRTVHQCLGGGLAQVLGLLGHRLQLRSYEFLLQVGEGLDIPHLHQPLCKLESARDIALGITEDFVAQFRAAHDSARNAALKELEVPVNCPSHLLHALFGDFAHIGRDFELWCRAHSALRSTEPGIPRWLPNRREYSRFSAFSQDAREARTTIERCWWLLMSRYRWRSQAAGSR